MYVTPLRIEILDDEAPMAMLSGMFATQQKGSRFEEILRDEILNFPLGHQVNESFFVGLPITVVLLVSVKEFLGWG